MKLITKSILLYLLISLPLLAVSGMIGYLLVKNELRDTADEALWKEKLTAEKIIKSARPLQVVFLSSDSLSKIIPDQSAVGSYQYKDSLLYDTFEEENIPYRFLTGTYTYNSKTYLISLARSGVEDDDLMESLLSVFAILIAFLLIAFFIVNWLSSKILWKPFYKTIHKLNKLNLNTKTILLEPTRTKEFSQLNEALEKMIHKVHTDFMQQKEFTENAAHEMQTPLAIIKANIGLLLQSSDLGLEEMNQLQAIENTTKRLSSLNKALLLLAKIENKQFTNAILVNINEKIVMLLDTYRDLAEAKNITITTEFNNLIEVQMDSALADILISNLLQNAIRHNYNGGGIAIQIKEHALSISNSGSPLSISKDELFVRFKKNDASKDSLGLGLSIVKSIAAVYGIETHYFYEPNNHTFTLQF